MKNKYLQQLEDGEIVDTGKLSGKLELSKVKNKFKISVVLTSPTLLDSSNKTLNTRKMQKELPRILKSWRCGYIHIPSHTQLFKIVKKENLIRRWDRDESANSYNLSELTNSTYWKLTNLDGCEEITYEEINAKYIKIGFDTNHTSDFLGAKNGRSKQYCYNKCLLILKKVIELEKSLNKKVSFKIKYKRYKNKK